MTGAVRSVFADAVQAIEWWGGELGLPLSEFVLGRLRRGARLAQAIHRQGMFALFGSDFQPWCLARPRLLAPSPLEAPA